MAEQPLSTVLGLDPSERVLWRSPRKGRDGGYRFKFWIRILLVLVGVFVIAAIFIPAAAPYILGACLLLIVSLAVWIQRMDKRDAFFLAERRIRELGRLVTERRIIERGLLRNRSLSLVDVRSAARMEARPRLRGVGALFAAFVSSGEEMRATDCVALDCQMGGTTSFGPIPDVERICDLINLLVAGEIDMGELPAVIGDPSPAERRTDVLLARTHRIDGMDFGLLIVGSTYVYRVAETLPPRVEARLFHSLAEAKNAAEAEAAVAVAMSDRESGYVQRLERIKAQPRFDGGFLVLKRPEGDDRIELLPEDHERFRGVLVPASDAPHK